VILPDELAQLLQVSCLIVIRKAKKSTTPSFKVGTYVQVRAKVAQNQSPIGGYSDDWVFSIFLKTYCSRLSAPQHIS
jgi:hypothetical protein